MSRKAKSAGPLRAKDAKRAALLVGAMEGVDGLVKAMRRTKPNPFAGNRRGMQITVGDWSEEDGTGDCQIELDLPTARKLIPFLLEIIGDEITALGVEL